MSFLSRLFGREQRRDATVGLSDPSLTTFLSQRSTGGTFVDADRASSLAVANACMSVISQNLAAMPLNLYERTADGGRELATAHPLHEVLHDRFNETMTAFEGREFLVVSLLTNGNAFARIEWNGRGQVDALHPLHPRLVGVERLESGRLRYRVSPARGGATRTFLQEEILHLRYRLDRDGVMGVSPIQHSRDTFALALNQQDQAAKQTSKAFRARGVLSTPHTMSSEVRDRLLGSWAEKLENESDGSGLILMDGGADFKPMSFTSKDAEFLESRKLTNMDVARIFSVPPTVVGITDNATYSNVDGESRALVQRCLAPMARRMEQAMSAALLTAEGRRRYFVEHDLLGLLRGDQKARFEAYRIAREWGWMSPNEIRRLENMRKIEGGDEYLSPLNMTRQGEREGADDGQS